MTIGTKFGIAFVICAALIAAAVSGVWINLNHEGQRLDELNVVAQGNVEGMSHSISNSRVAMYAYLATRNPARAVDAHDHLDEFNRHMAEFHASLAYQKDPNDRLLVIKSQDARDALEPLSDRLEAQFSRSLPITSQLEAYEKAAAVAQSASDALAAHRRDHVIEQREELLADVKKSKLLLLVAGAGAFGLAVAMMLLISTWVTRPINRLTQAIERVSAGELDDEYVNDASDEVGVLARAFIDMRVRLKSAIDGMNEEVDERRCAEAELNDMNARLGESVQQLEVGASQAAMMLEMGEIIQSAVDVDEAFAIIAAYTGRLLPGTSGRLHILDVDGEIAHSVKTFGPRPGSVATFQHDQCWALRTGRSHVSKNPETDLRCSHIRKSEVPCICSPLIARGEVVGVLSVLCRPGTRLFSDDEQRLAEEVAERGALAIADLRLKAALEEQSIRDPLTGLFNRRFLAEWLDRELARAERESATVGLAMLDIDNLKRINDAYGHGAGDEALRDMGSFLMENIRSGDVACRYGGDEFVVILTKLNLKAAHNRSEALRESWMSIAPVFGEMRVTPTVSIGVAAYPVDATTSEGLLAAADTALYRAKAEGRDRVASGPPACSGE